MSPVSFLKSVFEAPFYPYCTELCKVEKQHSMVSSVVLTTLWSSFFATGTQHTHVVSVDALYGESRRKTPTVNGWCPSRPLSGSGLCVSELLCLLFQFYSLHTPSQVYDPFHIVPADDCMSVSSFLKFMINFSSLRCFSRLVSLYHTNSCSNSPQLAIFHPLGRAPPLRCHQQIW